MAEEIRYRLQYVGDDADRHILPAHSGSQSLEGISWSVSVLANYLATGRLKKRGALDTRIQVFIAPAQQGSFVDDLLIFVTEPNNMFLTSIVGAHAVSTVGQVLNSFIVSAVRQVCGLPSVDDQQQRSWLDRFPSGDMEAALDAIEPSMKRAHSVIGEGATQLIIQRDAAPLVSLDRRTKAYVNANIEGEEIVQRIVSVGALNVNTGNGRAYLPDIGKTVPFNVVREPDTGTYQALSYSLDRYARGLPDHVQIRCREIFANDDRIKRLVVYGAQRIDDGA